MTEALKLEPARAWRYSINYGPDGEANYAMVYDDDGVLVGNLKTHHAIAVVEQANRRAGVGVPQLGGAPDDLRNLIRVVFADYGIDKIAEVTRKVLDMRDPALAPKDAEPVETRPSPDRFAAFQSEINPDVWYVGDERVAYLRTEIGVGNPEHIAKRAAAGLNASHPTPEPAVTAAAQGIIDRVEKVPLPKSKLGTYPAPEPAGLEKAVEALAENSWSLVCKEYPIADTGDADVGYEVVSYHMARPKERVEGAGATPAEALRAAGLLPHLSTSPQAQKRIIKGTSRTGYGIVNPHGQMWTTDIFETPEAAREHFDAFWRGIQACTVLRPLPYRSGSGAHDGYSAELRSGAEAMKLTAFENAVLTQMKDIPDGYIQRIDGVRAFTKGDWRFFRFRLNRMVRKGLLRRASVRSLWPSLDGMPGYAPTPAGRAALQEGHDGA